MISKSKPEIECRTFWLTVKAFMTSCANRNFIGLLSQTEKPIFKTFKTELESQYADFIDFNANPLNPNVAEAFGTDKPFNMLLRPDNYVGLISSETSCDEIKIYLKDVIGYW